MILTSRRATLMMLKNFIQIAIIIKIDKEREIQKNIFQCDVILLNWLALWDRFNSFVCCTFYTVKFILFVTTNDKKKCLEIKRTREIFLIRSLSNKKIVCTHRSIPLSHTVNRCLWMCITIFHSLFSSLFYSHLSA